MHTRNSTRPTGAAAAARGPRRRSRSAAAAVDGASAIRHVDAAISGRSCCSAQPVGGSHQGSSSSPCSVRSSRASAAQCACAAGTAAAASSTGGVADAAGRACSGVVSSCWAGDCVHNGGRCCSISCKGCSQHNGSQRDSKQQKWQQQCSCAVAQGDCCAAQRFCCSLCSRCLPELGTELCAVPGAGATGNWLLTNTCGWQQYGWQSAGHKQ